MNREIQTAILRACARHMAKLLQPIEQKLAQLEQRAMTAGPRGADGKDGAPGVNGKDAVAPTVDEIRDAVLPVIEIRAKEWFAANPPAPGEKGADGRDGIHGTSITLDDVRPLIEGEMSKWALDFERRAQGVLERAVERMPAAPAGRDGRDGIDGKDGADALGFDDLEVIHDGGRGFVIRFARGDAVKEFGFQVPSVLDAGVFKESAEYAHGDAVSFGGSLWIAQKDAPVGKPGLSEDWRLAVKRGRDGKDGRNGIDKAATVSIGGYQPIDNGPVSDPPGAE